MKHTPGPWEIRDYMIGIHPTSLSESIGPIYYSVNRSGEKETEIICDSIEFEANAKLVAAAPEMLDALIKCKNLLSRLHFGGALLPDEDHVLIEAERLTNKFED